MTTSNGWFAAGTVSASVLAAAQARIAELEAELAECHKATGTGSDVTRERLVERLLLDDNSAERVKELLALGPRNPQVYRANRLADAMTQMFATTINTGTTQ